MVQWRFNYLKQCLFVQTRFYLHRDHLNQNVFALTVPLSENILTAWLKCTFAIEFILRSKTGKIVAFSMHNTTLLKLNYTLTKYICWILITLMIQMQRSIVEHPAAES